MKDFRLSEDQARTVIAVFGELKKMKYSDLNTFLGSITIEEMNDLYFRLHKKYFPEKYRSHSVY